ALAGPAVPGPEPLGGGPPAVPAHGQARGCRGNGAAPQLLPRRPGLRPSLRLRGRRRPGPLRGPAGRAPAPPALVALLGAGAGMCAVRWRTGDVDPGSDGCPSSRAIGQGPGHPGASGGAAEGSAARVPVRPGLPPPALPLGTDAPAPGAPDGAG